MENNNYIPPNTLLANMQALRDYVGRGGENEAEALASSLKVGIVLNLAKRFGIDVSPLELEMEQIQEGIDSLEEKDYVKINQNNN